MAFEATTNTKMPRDADAMPIQVLALDGRVSLTSSSPTQTRSALPAGAEVVRVALSVASYVLFGGSSVAVVASTGHFFPAGVEYFRVDPADTHLSVVAQSSAGVGTITRLI